MSDKTKFARDFPEVCDLWKAFDMRARYNADNMMHAYCAGYAARAESIADQAAPTETRKHGVMHLVGCKCYECVTCVWPAQYQQAPSRAAPDPRLAHALANPPGPGGAVLCACDSPPQGMARAERPRRQHRR